MSRIYYVDAQIEIDGAKDRENDLRTLVAIKDQDIDDLRNLLARKDKEIDDLQETLALYEPKSPPDVNALIAIINHVAQQSEEVAKTSQQSEDLASTTRVYQKKNIVYVRSQPVLDALIRMATLMFPHQRNIRQGYSFDEFPNSYSVRYAFYYGKINRKGEVGLITTIVLSSEIKVYKITDISKPVIMNWVRDLDAKGKRKFGNIYLGTLTGEKGFETDIRPVFKPELGLTR